jgi:CRP-like cAMP-binding protein
MYLIQSGKVKIQTMAVKGIPFTIEKLYRGSIINHNSFLFKDPMCTNAVCVTEVRAFSMSYSMLKEIRARNETIDKALDIVEIEQI